MRTIVSIYGDALTPDMREASGNVARFALNGRRNSRCGFVSYGKDGGLYRIEK